MLFRPKIRAEIQILGKTYYLTPVATKLVRIALRAYEETSEWPEGTIALKNQNGGLSELEVRTVGEVFMNQALEIAVLSN